MKRSFRWLSLALVMVLCLGFLSGPAKATEDESGEALQTTDFVLVLDCSGSMDRSDREGWSVKACEQFVDSIPVENARVAIMAFGFAEGNGYDFHNRDYAAEGLGKTDNNRVHLVTDLVEANTMEEKDAIKTSLAAAVEKGNKSHTYTPAGTALLAAADLLEKNNSAKGCIILMTDGRITGNDYVDEQPCADLAADIAAENRWPIYTIELNQDGRNNPGASNVDNEKKARAFMQELAEKTDGQHVIIQNSSAISEAFMEIFGRFMSGNAEESSRPIKAEETVDFEIPRLTSEATIIINGATLEYLKLVDPEGNEIQVREDTEKANIIASVEKGYYITVKLICPAEGTWQVTAYGDPDASFTMYDIAMQDLDLTLTSDLVAGQELDKNQSITFNSCFTYHSNEVGTSSYYNEKQPELLITNTVTGKTDHFPMEVGANGSGYTVTVQVEDLGSGAFQAQAKLMDNMFVLSGGVKYSEMLTFKTINLPVKALKSAIADTSANLKSQVEVDLAQYFTNDDNDPLEYSLECVSDRDAEFVYEISDTQYLTLETGMMPGTYELLFKVWDADMGKSNALEFTWNLEVINQGYSTNEVPEQKLWISCFFFQKEQQELNQVVIDLAEYIYHLDEMPSTYALTESSWDAQLVTATLEGSVLTVDALAKGETQISFTVSDGVGGQVEGTVKILVVNGMLEFLGDNWIWITLILGALVLLIIIIYVLFANKKVKGRWDIKVHSNFMDPSRQIFEPTANFERLDIRGNTTIGRKGRFLLKDFLAEFSAIAPDDANYFGTLFAGSTPTGTPFDKIELKGVFFGHGCAVLNVPTSDLVEVSCGGKRTGNFRVKAGNTMTIKVRMENEDLTITMTVR